MMHGLEICRRQTYGTREDGFAPAAAFDVIDLDPAKMKTVRDSVTPLDSALVDAAQHRTQRLRSAKTHARSTAWCASP